MRGIELSIGNWLVDRLFQRTCEAQKLTAEDRRSAGRESTLGEVREKKLIFGVR